MKLTRWFEMLKAKLWGSKKPNDLVDKQQSASVLELNVPLPDFNKNDIRIEAGNGKISVSTQKRVHNIKQSQGLTFSQYAFASFSKTWPLPANVDSDNIEATWNDGILKIVCPQLDPVKRIMVK
ncbi:Hsp20/alpha crystallin family protein [Cytophagaceae bacterium ABcell3]|nr:Hsp20/alpha crystallin family protein [Cytophagaceae bacterium ABcell3]